MSRFPEARFLRSAVKPGAFGDDSGAEVAFAGRSNSGKSSALNAIAGRRKLARTSAMPGRTQSVNFFELRRGLRVADLPGYGFANVPGSVRASWARLMDGYFSARQSLTGVVLIVDSRRGIRPDDETLLGYAAARGLPVHVLLTKSDKLGRQEARKALVTARAGLAGRASVQLFSATSGEGADAALAALDALAVRKAGQKRPGDPKIAGQIPGLGMQSG